MYEKISLDSSAQKSYYFEVKNSCETGLSADNNLIRDTRCNQM
jgi:hypothetical protein